MALVLISSRYQAGREELARALARKTNWAVVSREELQEEARKWGIKVGRLEMSVIKRPASSEKLAREKDLYLAFVTASLCEKALQGDVIYCGRAGHLLLPGVGHRLRVGLTAPREIRLERTARALNMAPDKAETYLDALDEDVERWMRYIHGVDGSDPSRFDAVFNLEQLGLTNAAAILCNMAELPDFQPTIAGNRMLQDLLLTSQAKLRLARDERTQAVDLQVRTDNGVVTVTYPPHQESVRDHIPQLLSELDGCREIQCTMAETNILWVQEHFDPKSESFDQIVQLSNRWGAAVELMRLVPPELGFIPPATDPAGADYGFGGRDCPFPGDGGVQEDGPADEVDDGGLAKTQEVLVDLGRSGGLHTVCGGHEKILESAQGKGRYALVVIGNLFLSKGHSTRTRRTRELAMTIRDRLKAPVITADELKSKLLFGKRQAVKLVGFAALVALIYEVVFTHQDAVLNFLSGPPHAEHPWLAPIVVASFVPAIAYIYGTVTDLMLKIINID